jgi:aryl-alcohol dehydrogenase-like predicted oxidoreductase
MGAAAAHDVRVITRVVDYGGLFWDDVLPGTPLRRFDHRAFRPEGWVAAGRERMDRMRPVAERHGLTMLQLAAQWNVSHEPVACVAPTLIQEAGEAARPIEDKRAELAAVPAEPVLSPSEVAELRAIGDNAGCMTLKGAAVGYDGPPSPDRWPLAPELEELGRRWGIEADRDLAPAPA